MLKVMTTMHWELILNKVIYFMLSFCFFEIIFFTLKQEYNIYSVGNQILIKFEIILSSVQIIPSPERIGIIHFL